ncbi:GNAT family N-acetyltransferase [Niabella insulamsoli]|uniref:GNAT family N-acetyltransferase n=1 Tax=Niabella insulamsoli TaxID=3144874 RepID=UPI0031FD2EE9
MEQIEIKRITPHDVTALQNIAIQTFQETFSASNTEADMQQYLKDNFTIEKLTIALEEKNARFYFALLNETVLGYLKINTGAAQTELKKEHSLEIERIYVLKDFQGKRVGQLLYDKALEIAREEKVDYVWLGVWEENMRALHFYKKNGFVAFDQHIFKLGDDDQIDIMMKLPLKG